MPRSKPYGILAAGIAPLLVSAGCGTLPRDPQKTLDRVQQQKRVRVGVVVNPPWVVYSAGEPGGAEVELVRRFASSLGARPIWIWGGEQEHLEALKRFELDIVIGGLDEKTPWAKTVGLTKPYFTERVLVGIPAGTQPPDSLKGATVSVKAGDPAASYLAKKDAVAVRMTDLSHANSGLVAAPDWRLSQLGLTATKFDLLDNKHVMAAPPGENGWLKRLQEFLNSQRPQVPALLQKSEALQQSEAIPHGEVAQ